MCDFQKAASSSKKPEEKCTGEIEMCDFQKAAPTDPAGMYLDPLTTAEGRAAMMRGEVLPEVGEQISLWKKAGKKLGKFDFVSRREGNSISALCIIRVR